MDKPYRRQFLKLGSSGIVAGLAGCSSPQSAEDPTEASSTTETSKRELRDRIVELETKLEILRETLDEKDERIESLEAELDELKERESTEESQDGAITRFSDEELERARTVAKEVREAVVTIRGENGGGGVAWFLDDGYVMTNSHVVDGQSNFECWTINGESFNPTLLGQSEFLNQPYEDVAVLETDFKPPNTLPLGASSSLTKDQPVVLVGHPAMLGNWVPSIGRYVKDGYSDTVLTTAPSEQGNSGGPLVTLEGNVVGILTGSVRRDQSGSSTAPEPKELKLYEEFPDGSYSSHDKTSIIEKYVEKFG